VGKLATDFPAWKTAQAVSHPKLVFQSLLSRMLQAVGGQGMPSQPIPPPPAVTPPSAAPRAGDGAPTPA